VLCNLRPGGRAVGAEIGDDGGEGGDELVGGGGEAEFRGEGSGGGGRRRGRRRGLRCGARRPGGSLVTSEEWKQGVEFLRGR